LLDQIRRLDEVITLTEVSSVTSSADYDFRIVSHKRLKHWHCSADWLSDLMILIFKDFVLFSAFFGELDEFSRDVDQVVV